MTVGQGVHPAYRCPRCGSDDTASLPAIHQAGTTSSRTAIVGLVGDTLAVGQAGGVSTTAIADRAAPPQRADQTVANLLIGIPSALLVIAIMVWANQPRHGGAPIPWSLWDFLESAVLLVLAAILIVSGIGTRWANQRYDATTWPRLYARWQQTWMCRRCGTPFSPAR